MAVRRGPTTIRTSSVLCSTSKPNNYFPRAGWAESSHSRGMFAALSEFASDIAIALLGLAVGAGWVVVILSPNSSYDGNDSTARADTQIKRLLKDACIPITLGPDGRWRICHSRTFLDCRCERISRRFWILLKSLDPCSKETWLDAARCPDETKRPAALGYGFFPCVPVHCDDRLGACRPSNLKR